MIVLGIDPGAKHHGYGVIAHDHGASTFIATGTLPEEAPIAASLRALVVQHAATLVAIEKPKMVFAKSGFGTQMAGNLLDMAFCAGVLWEAATATGVHVELVDAQDWRRAVCSSRQADDKKIAEVLRIRVRGMPTRSNVHGRDGLGLAVYAAMRASLPEEIRRVA